MRKFIVSVNGASYEVDVEEISGDSIAKAAPAVANVPVAPAPQAASAPKAAPTPKTPVSANAAVINSPMPGAILGVNVKVGDTVKEGDVLMLLEAMKMENEIMSPRKGKVVALNVEKGSSVNAGEVLAIIE